ncbi:MAG: hypothetical protein IKO74_04895 [Selenomonadaceae bacterium]|nr:hypothetical protein [Selenomonadaceae bacterium]
MSQIQEESRQVSISINEMILMQLRDLKENQRELKAEIKDVRLELRETRKELNALMGKQDEKIDRLASKIDAFSNHGQIATISSVGIGLSAVSITLGVLYTLFFK